MQASSTSPPTEAAPGLIIAAPASGSGKTVVTLALLRAFAQAGVRVASAKIGPDYIDPAYHHAASGAPCLNLDSWAMRPDAFSTLVRQLSDNAALILCEGVMGLFDGAHQNSGDLTSNGSTADVAARTGWPVVLVVDARGQAQSAAALIEGFVQHRRDINVTGVIFNRAGGDRHALMLRDAAARTGVAVLGCLPRDSALILPERHLGLVQAGEHDSLDAFLDGAARIAANALDLDALRALARPANGFAPAHSPNIRGPGLAPLGQTIAIARDDAFAFAYPALLDRWRAMGADLQFFSPLGDEAPNASAGAVYLPGGYPELHAGRLAGNERFLSGLRQAAAGGAAVYGECGGYMVLGETLTSADGAVHRMGGLLPLRTSFAAPKLHLGYRRAETLAATPLGQPGTRFTGHEFHYAAIVEEGPGPALFRVADASGGGISDAGLAIGTVAGSFVHLIDHAAEDTPA